MGFAETNDLRPSATVLDVIIPPVTQSPANISYMLALWDVIYTVIGSFSRVANTKRPEVGDIPCVKVEGDNVTRLDI